MRPYEIVVILNSALEDDAISNVLSRAGATIESGGGKLNRTERWGRKKFAYEIDHRQEGYYALLEATAPPEAIPEIERTLRLADEVIRHKVIRIPDKVAGAKLAKTGPKDTPSANGE